MKSSHCKILKLTEEKQWDLGQEDEVPQSHGDRTESNCQIQSRVRECPGTTDSIA